MLRSEIQDSAEITQRGGSMIVGLLVSSVFHLVILLLVILGLPIFWEPEVLPEAIGIELAQLSDITAAPKVDKAGKPDKKPEPEKQPEPKKEEPKKEPAPAKPNPPAPAAPPPPEPKPEPVLVPEKPVEKKPEEKKPEPPKKEEPKKKVEKKEEKKKEEKKASEEELDTLLKNVLQEQPAPETPEQPKKKAEPPPVPESTGPQTANVSEIPMTASEEDGIRAQIEKNWNLGSILGSPNLVGLMVELRIELQPDGTVTRVTLLNDKPGDSFFRAAAESARRAVMISSPLQLPPGKEWPTMRLRFHPDQVVQ